MNANPKKSNIMLIQNKFYESLKQKELMYREIEENNKINNEENNINFEFNYPYYIFQEIKKKEKEEKKMTFGDHEEEQNDNKIDNNNYEKVNKNIQLIKTNAKYNILYEY